MRRAGSLLLLLALLGIGAIPLMLGGSAAVAFSLQLSASGYASLAALVLASAAFRAIKQGVLMRKLGVHSHRWRVLAISQATEMAFLATPGGIGGYAAGVLYLRREGATFAAATAISAADQILDLVFFAVAMPLALVFLVDAPEVGVLRSVAQVGAAVMVVGLFAVALTRKQLGRWLFVDARAPGWLERMPRLRGRSVELRGFLRNLSIQLGELTAMSPGIFAALCACTALQWLTRYGVLWLVMTLLGHPIPLALLFLLQGVVLHAAQWTGAPAGAGGADVGLAAILAAFAPAEAIAAALLLWRFATLHLNLLAGLVCVLALRDRGISAGPHLATAESSAD